MMMQRNLEKGHLLEFIVSRPGITLSDCYNRIVRRYYSIVNLFRRFNANAKRWYTKQKYSPTLLYPADQALLEKIQHHGVATGHLNDLKLEITSDMWKATQSLILTLPSVGNQEFRHKWDSSEHCIYANAGRIAAEYPEIILWGLNERLLDIIENHMQSPSALVNVSVRQDIPNGHQIGTRLWHLDQYDRSVIKVLIYLNDVDRSAGPFEYVSKTYQTPKQKFLSCMQLSLRHKFRKDDGFKKLIPPNNWRPVIGPSGSTIIADTSTTFHHGAVPTHGERLVLVYTYTTQWPTKQSLSKGLSPETDILSSLLRRLSPRQQEALLGWKS